MRRHGGQTEGRILTAVVVGGGKLGALVAAAGAVAGLHLELVPGGFAQLAEEQLSGGVGLEALPRPRAFGSEVQHEVGDGAAPAGPALQVEPCVGGVDVGEQRLVFVEHRFCGEDGAERLRHNSSWIISHHFCVLLYTCLKI